MKKQYKGVIFLVLFGGGLLFWATAASVPGIAPDDPDSTVTITGTPADNFPDVQRPQFCSSGQPQSNPYIREYRIPTECTQPLAITADPSGNVWFAQTNTGNVAKFDPRTENFTEYENPRWPERSRSMMWGMDWSPDDSVWFTDDTHNAIWKFSIPDEVYTRTSYPTAGNSLPQRLEIDGSRIIVNDFLGGKLTLLDLAEAGGTSSSYMSIPTPINGSITSDFAVDEGGNIWYTNWIVERGGVLVRMNLADYEMATASEREAPPLSDHIRTYSLPASVGTPNGVVTVPGYGVWIADTGSSHFFGFDEARQTFTRYATSEPPLSTFGNATGVIRDTPLTRPYWLDTDDSGRIIFNEQTGNRIGVFDPTEQSLVEYLIPSKNPNWSDCEDLADCGLAQALAFTVSGDKVWFTEWVENNIGVLDTSAPLSAEIELDSQQITLERGEFGRILATITADVNTDATLVLGNAAPSGYLLTGADSEQVSGPYPQTIGVNISAASTASGGDYKVLVGVQSGEVTVSKYVTVTVR